MPKYLQLIDKKTPTYEKRGWRHEDPPFVCHKRFIQSLAALRDGNRPAKQVIIDETKALNLVKADIDEDTAIHLDLANDRQVFERKAESNVLGALAGYAAFGVGLSASIPEEVREEAQPLLDEYKKLRNQPEEEHGEMREKQLESVRATLVELLAPYYQASAKDVSRSHQSFTKSTKLDSAQSQDIERTIFLAHNLAKALKMDIRPVGGGGKTQD